MAASRHAHPRVEIPVLSLAAVAARFDRVVDDLRAGARRLRRSSSAVRLNSADPAIDPAEIRAHLRRAAHTLDAHSRLLESDAALCRSTAAAAMAADRVLSSPASGFRTGLHCALPDRHRQPVDRFLTGVIGYGLELSTRALIGVAHQLLPPPTSGAEAAAGMTNGDLGGTYSARPVDVPVREDTNPVAVALTAAGDETLLANDEFGLIDHGDDRYTVVLPGVTDLTAPEPGWNAMHRTVRDLDQVAIASSRSPGVGANRYAEMVAAGLARHVEPGAELALVGYSFGAGTALDLAGDPAFSDRYRLTQVVAAGHHVESRLHRLTDAYPVLVVENRNDLVVRAESLMPFADVGVFGCSAQPARPANVDVVVFGGGWSGLGHDVDHYRRLFADGDGLDGVAEHDAQSIDAALDRLADNGFGPTVTMLAIDVSVPHDQGGRR